VIDFERLSQALVERAQRRQARGRMVVHVSEVFEHGYWGEVMATAAKVRRIAGLVIDGCVRDLAGGESMNHMGCISRTITPQTYSPSGFVRS
jgi:regulator of RNase E activity RraA